MYSWRYRVTTDIYIILCKYLSYCYKDLIDLHYKLSECHSFLAKWTFEQIGYFAQFGPLNKIELFYSSSMSSIFSLYLIIWALNACYA